MKKLWLVLLLTVVIPSGGWGEDGFDKPINRLTLFELGYTHMGSGSSDLPVGLALSGYEHISRSGWALQIQPLSFYVWSGVVESGPFSQTTYYPGGGSLTVTNPSNREAVVLNYAPLWVKYYFRGWSHKAWPYVGAGPAYHQYDQDQFFPDEISSANRIVPAFVVGIDFGEKLFKRGNFNIKVFPGGTAPKDGTLFAFCYGLSFGWAQE